MDIKNTIKLLLNALEKSRPTDGRLPSRPLFPESTKRLYDAYAKIHEGEKPLTPSSSQPGPSEPFVDSSELEVENPVFKIINALKERYKIDFRCQNIEQIKEIIDIIEQSGVPFKHIVDNIGLKVISVIDDDSFLAKHNHEKNSIDLSSAIFDPEWRKENPFHRIETVPALWELLVHEIGHAVEKHLHETDKPIIDPIWHETTGWKYPHGDEKELKAKGYVPALETFLKVPEEKMDTLEDGDKEVIIKRIKIKNPYELSGKQIRISWYGCVGPREDFAESYANYILNPKEFKESDPERYEYMQRYIFDGKEYSPSIMPFIPMQKSFDDTGISEQTLQTWKEIEDETLQVINQSKAELFNIAFDKIINSQQYLLGKEISSDIHVRENLKILLRHGFKSSQIIVGKLTPDGEMHYWIELNVGTKKVIVDTHGDGLKPYIGETKSEYSIEKSRGPKKKPYGHTEYMRIVHGKPQMVPAKGVKPTNNLEDDLRAKKPEAFRVIFDEKNYVHQYDKGLIKSIRGMFVNIAKKYSSWIEIDDALSAIKVGVYHYISKKPKPGQKKKNIKNRLEDIAILAVRNEIRDNYRYPNAGTKDMWRIRKLRAIKNSLLAEGKAVTAENILKRCGWSRKKLDRIEQIMEPERIDAPVISNDKEEVYQKEIPYIDPKLELTEKKIDWKSDTEEDYIKKIVLRALETGVLSREQALLVNLIGIKRMKVKEVKRKTGIHGVAKKYLRATRKIKKWVLAEKSKEAQEVQTQIQQIQQENKKESIANDKM